MSNSFLTIPHQTDSEKKWMTYVADIGQGHVVNLFGDFRWRAVRSGGQSLSAHFLQQTLWSLQRHQELALQLGPAEQNTKMSYLWTRGQQSRRRETFWHQMLTYDMWKGLKWTDWHFVFLQIVPMLFSFFFFFALIDFMMKKIRSVRQVKYVC